MPISTVKQVFIKNLQVLYILMYKKTNVGITRIVFMVSSNEISLNLCISQVANHHLLWKRQAFDKLQLFFSFSIHIKLLTKLNQNNYSQSHCFLNTCFTENLPFKS